MPTIDVRRAGDRFHTDLGWLDSWHSFSFGHHDDPTNVGHGLLLVSNDDVVAAGRGFGTHPHRDMEIVTWVLEGELAHRDSTGTDGVIYPGLAQRMSAGTGITHSEMNARADRPVHFIQMWVVPDTERVPPSYEQADVNDQLAAGGLVLVASGRDDTAAVHIHQRDAELRVGRLVEGHEVTVPDAPHAHVFVAAGRATLAGEHHLVAGDAARLTAAGALELRADPAAEVLIWTTA
jgi:quercetin 2,3-dioxygenase